MVLSSEAPYVSGLENPALALAGQILDSRGAAPRLCRNSLVFLAADRTRRQDLDEALRHFPAWDSIVRDVEKLNLDPHQVGQAKAQLQAAEAAVSVRIPETYQWLLVPEQESPSSGLSWKALRLSASGHLAERAARRLLKEELLVADLGPTVLRLHLDKVPLWRGDHVGVRQLVDDFGQYLYLPRLKNAEVLIHAIKAGAGLRTWENRSLRVRRQLQRKGGALPWFALHARRRCNARQQRPTGQADSRPPAKRRRDHSTAETRWNPAAR